MIKICKECNIEQEIKSGRICGKCKYAKRKNYHKDYYIENKDDIKVVQNEYYKDNKDDILKKHKEYRENHIEELKEYRENNDRTEYFKNYYIENKDDIITYQSEYNKKNYVPKEKKPKLDETTRKENNKKYRDKRENKDKRNKKLKEKRDTDILYRFKCNMRSATYGAFNKKGYVKDSKTENILGCSYEELKVYIESKFEDWMTYDNYGLYNGTYNYGWDIDHIKPLSHAKSEAELLELCHYTNLQPLCSKINRDIKKDT